MKTKKFLALLLAMVMTLALVACGGSNNDTPANDDSPAQSDTNTPADDTSTPDPAPAPTGAGEITLWTYPIGNWGDEAVVKSLTDAFTTETGIFLSVEFLVLI